MKATFVLGACLVTLSLAAPAPATQPRAYQVTGSVVAVDDTMITVLNGREAFEITRGKDTGVTGAVKVGGKVTVFYRMTATSIEAKDEEAAKPGAPDAGLSESAEMAGPQPHPSAPDPAARQRLANAEAAAEKLPNDYTTLVSLGNAAYDAEEFGKAVDAYERALKVKGGDANVLTDLGASYRNVGQIDKALETFEKARKADPNHWQSLFNAAVVYVFDKKDPKKAKELLAELKRVKPDLPELAALEEEIAKAGR